MTTFIATNIPSEMELNWSRVYDITQLLLDTEYGWFAPETGNEWPKYRALLLDLMPDRRCGSSADVVLGLRQAPASKNRHHNVQGGLVIHMLQMWNIWQSLRPVLVDHLGGSHGLLTDQLVWKCILHHDLNKVWKYRLISVSPWKVDYANDADELTYVLGDTHKVIHLLNKHQITLTPVLHNALITAEGGFSPSPRPKTESVLAKLAYLLDEMSANIVDRLQTNRFWDSKEGGLREIP